MEKLKTDIYNQLDTFHQNHINYQLPLNEALAKLKKDMLCFFNQHDVEAYFELWQDWSECNEIVGHLLLALTIQTGRDIPNLYRVLSCIRNNKIALRTDIL